MGIKCIKKIDDDIRQKLKQFLPFGKFSEINSAILNRSVAKSLMYPTNDFHLYEDQFSAVKAMLSPGEDLFLLQMGFNDGFYSNLNDIYVCESNLSYTEYEEIWLDSISVIASSSWEWIVLVDEAYEGGLGVFTSNRKAVSRFDSIYGKTTSDMVAFVEYFIKRTKKMDYSLEYMMDILSLCKDKTES